MTKTRSTKRALLMSGLALLMCVSMLIGSTFAWFTDSVTSKGNIIQSGKLDVEMYWKDASETGKQTTYLDASEGAIFNYDKWEPGYVEAKNLKICNVGNLALKYQLRILANGVVSTLAEVIDVYYVGNEKEMIKRTDLTEDMKLGTLSEVLRNPEKAIATKVSGSLQPGDEVVVTLALKMQESAGNEYQNLSIGSDFSIQLLATQFTYEEDSFNDQYDKDADFPAEENPKATVSQFGNDVASRVEIVDLNGNSIATGMDAAYAFQPTETYEQSKNSKHVWSHADFYVYADKDVPAESMALAGYYSLFGEFLGIDEYTWIGLTSSDTIKANSGIRLLRDGMGLSVAYSEICNYGNDGTGFLCGAKDITGANAGTTLTVELRLYEVECSDPGCHHNNFDCETGEYVTAGTFTYTFPKGENNGYVVSDAASLKAALANGEKDIAVSGVIELTEGLAATDVIFTGVGDNSGINFNGNNIGGSGTITYKNLTLTTLALGNDAGERAGFHGGIDYVGHTTANYVDCNISGVFTTYSDIVNATGCTFDYYVQDGEEYYGLFLYDSGVVNATDCTFMYGDRAIKIYSEGPAEYELNIKGGKVVATNDYKINKAIINVDSSAFKSAKISVDGLSIDEKLASVQKHNAEGDAKVAVLWN